MLSRGPSYGKYKWKSGQVIKVISEGPLRLGGSYGGYDWETGFVWGSSKLQTTSVVLENDKLISGEALSPSSGMSLGLGEEEAIPNKTDKRTTKQTKLASTLHFLDILKRLKNIKTQFATCLNEKKVIVIVTADLD